MNIRATLEHISSMLRRNAQRPVCIIVGSAPSAPKIADYDLSRFVKVAVNNSWKIRNDFDFICHADDFPDNNLPNNNYRAQLVSAEQYMPAINDAGGIVFCGATMAFATGYWAVKNIDARVIGYFSSDMIYPVGTATHFYGAGTPDPLRNDVSLGSLEARSARLFANALQHGKIILNFSSEPLSRLVFPRLTAGEALALSRNSFAGAHSFFADFMRKANEAHQMEALARFDTTRIDYFNIKFTDCDLSLINKLDDFWCRSAKYIIDGWNKYTQNLT